METIDTVIIGAGQAGLATARELVSRGHDCVVLERNQAVGDGWRQQYDSLRLYSPTRHDGLPGLAFPGDPRSFPGKDDVAAYLQSYAAHFDLPVRLGVRVDRLAAAPDGDGFVVTTDAGSIACPSVVDRHRDLRAAPRTCPTFAAGLDPSILQLHSSEYRQARASCARGRSSSSAPRTPAATSPTSWRSPVRQCSPAATADSCRCAGTPGPCTSSSRSCCSPGGTC